MSVAPFTRILHPYSTEETGRVFVHVVYNDRGILSLTGVEGPMRDGNCMGSCGQITLRTFDETFTYAPGWSYVMLEQLAATWKRWHLNDMRGGSPRQEAVLRMHTYDRNDGAGFGHLAWAQGILAEAGMNPDAEYLHKGQPYSYGSAWLFEEVPDQVLHFLRSLPESKFNPAWY